MVDLRDPKLRASCFEVFLTDSQKAQLIAEYREEYKNIMRKALAFVREKSVPPKTNQGWANFILTWFSKFDLPTTIFTIPELKRLERAYKGRYTVEHAKLIEGYVKDLTPSEIQTLVTEAIATQTYAPTPKYYNAEARAIKRSREKPVKDWTENIDPRNSESLKKILDNLGVSNVKDALKKWRDL